MNTKKLVLSALMVAMFSGSAAFAGPGGKGNGNGRGARANDNGSNINGVIASQLKWANAAHASDEAFDNANPDSAVGLLASFSDEFDPGDLTDEEIAELLGLGEVSPEAIDALWVLLEPLEPLEPLEAPEVE